MTGTNHVLTGSLIGLSLGEPLLAIPLAFASHFVLDFLPHYGSRDHTGRHFLTVLGADAFCISGFLISLAVLQPQHWLLAVACGLVAASPDLMWLSYWIGEMRRRDKQPLNNVVERFHSRIQWGEKPGNWPYEVIWLTVITVLLVKIV